MDKIKIITDNVKMEDVLSYYNIEPIRKKYSCPFHNEKTPSASIYKNKFHCFGCGIHYSTIDFVMNMEKISISEAINLIGNIFNLDFDRKLTKAEKRKYAIKRREIKFKKMFKDLYQEILSNKYATACKNYSLMVDFYRKNVPKQINKEFRNSYISSEFIKLDKYIKKQEKYIDYLFNKFE